MLSVNAHSRGIARRKEGRGVATLSPTFMWVLFVGTMFKILKLCSEIYFYPAFCHISFVNSAFLKTLGKSGVLHLTLIVLVLAMTIISKMFAAGNMPKLHHLDVPDLC
jgi:hypothetical protein